MDAQRDATSLTERFNWCAEPRKFIIYDKESSKIVLKLFLKKPSTNYETSGSYESTDTKIFKKIEQELAF